MQLNSVKQLSPLTKLFLINGFAVLLLASWLIPFTRIIWDYIDNVVFLILNGSLNIGYYWRYFWAIANIRVFDIVPAVVILILFLWWSYRDKRYNQREQFVTLVLFLFFMGIMRWIFGKITDLIQYHRPSPSIVFPEETIMLSRYFPLIDPKDSSFWSFPGDHGFVLLCFMFFFIWYGAGKFRIIAVASLVFFNLPRMVSGAHWFTDIAIGSMVLALVTISLWFYTPLKDPLINWCVRKLKPLLDLVFVVLPERSGSG